MSDLQLFSRKLFQYYDYLHCEKYIELGNELHRLESVHGLPVEMGLPMIIDQFKLTPGAVVGVFYNYLVAKTKHSDLSGITENRKKKMQERNRRILDLLIDGGVDAIT